LNLQHFQAFVWLNWRLRFNQLRRGGPINVVILAILSVLLAVSAAGLFIGSFAVAFALTEVPPAVILFIWDGLVVSFLMTWCIGLLADLQRADSLSLSRFLHLPVSLTGVFVLNYVTSLLSFTMILFVPMGVGFALGLTFVKGPLMLLVLPLGAAFILMITGLTYQFQGWLASLMVDKRRRRTIIFFVTFGIVLAFQLPNLINIFRPWETAQGEVKELDAEMKELSRALAAKEITVEQHQQKTREAINRRQDSWKAAWQQAQDIGWLVNAVLPIGWLPLGAMGTTEGNPLPALLGFMGMTAIGAASLWRAYRTTVQFYTGQLTQGTRPAAQPVSAPATTVSASPPPDGMVAREIPGLSEPASAIALASFRSLLRAPEAKMLLLTPAIMVLIFGGMFWRNTTEMPIFVRPLLAFGAIAMILLTLVQLLGNQFGFDRSGFRVYVLSPAPRRDVLLGKNLAVAPVAFILVCPLILLLEVLHPMRIDHMLGIVPQFVSMYLLYCLLANLLSIYAPMAIAAGSLKPAKTQWWAIMIQMLLMWLFPLMLWVTLLPLGIEFGLDALGWVEGIPIALPLSLVVCVGVIFLYRRAIHWQGGLLQGREQRILEIVTSKAE
jgi:ABC-2 type transport system permease protein